METWHSSNLMTLSPFAHLLLDSQIGLKFETFAQDPVNRTVADSWLSEGQGRIKQRGHQLHGMGHWPAESQDAFMVTQFQTLF